MNETTEGNRLYVIGDVHGRLDLLDDMLARIRGDLAARPHPRPMLIMLGDYVDRGQWSRGVIERLIELEAADLSTVFLLGNHDSYIEAYLTDPDWYDRTYHWLHQAMGGAETLASYGVRDAHERDPSATHDAFAAAFPADHAAFLDRCRLWHRVGAYVFVHAGIRPGVPMEAQNRDDLIWIREPFLSSKRDFVFKVVHGHTIVPRVEHHPNRIAIDTGAIRSGVLSCLLLQDAEISLLGPDGPVPCPEGAGLTELSPARNLRNGLRRLWPGR
jgi:serine/threonine protein phosphatase 1